MEKGCIFLTPDNESKIVWIVTDYNVATGQVKMFYIIPKVLVTKLEIQITAVTGTTDKAIFNLHENFLKQGWRQRVKNFYKRKL